MAVMFWFGVLSTTFTLLPALLVWGMALVGETLILWLTRVAE